MVKCFSSMKISRPKSGICVACVRECGERDNTLSHMYTCNRVWKCSDAASSTRSAIGYMLLPCRRVTTLISFVFNSVSVCWMEGGRKGGREGGRRGGKGGRFGNNIWAR